MTDNYAGAILRPLCPLHIFPQQHLTAVRLEITIFGELVTGISLVVGFSEAVCSVGLALCLHCHVCRPSETKSLAQNEHTTHIRNITMKLERIIINHYYETNIIKVYVNHVRKIMLKL